MKFSRFILLGFVIFLNAFSLFEKVAPLPDVTESSTPYLTLTESLVLTSTFTWYQTEAEKKLLKIILSSFWGNDVFNNF